MNVPLLHCSLIALFPYYTSICFCVVIKILILYEGKNRKNFNQANLSQNSAQPNVIDRTSTLIISQ
jgi:hypothetical protein